MQNKTQKFKKGFTLIEILVVVSIISILASVTIATMRNVREKANDSRRKHDLQQIKLALELYNEKHGNYMESGSGCGQDGQGWFNYEGGAYTKSMSQCLIDDGFTPRAIIDPTGGVASTPTSGNAYMKYSCGHTFLYAKLESQAQSSTATDDTCCPTCDTSYGINYYIQVD